MGLEPAMGVKTLTTLARWVKTSNTQCPALSGSDISETWCWASLVVLLSESTCLFGWQLSVGKLGNLFLMVKKSYSRGEPAEILHEPNSVAICLPVWWIHSFAVQTVLSVPKNALIPLIAGFLWASFFFKQAHSCSFSHHMSWLTGSDVVCGYM